MADPVDMLAGNPVLQFALIAGTVVGGAVIAFLGSKGKKGDSSSDILHGIYRVLGEMRTDNARFANERNKKFDDLTEIVREVEHNTDRPRR